LPTYVTKIFKKKNPTYSSKINWNTLDKSSYRDALDKRIQFLNKNPISNQDIDTAFEDLCHVIVESTEEVAPKRKSKKKKPKLQIMSEEIFKAIQKKKTAFYHWKLKW